MELKKRSMDEMIANFNREVSCMDLSAADKMKLLGMITAIGFRYKEDVQFVHAVPAAELSTNLAEVGTDCISRKDVIDLWNKYHYCIATKAIEFDSELRALLSAEPQERKTGRWIRDEFGSRCGACGLYAYRDKFDRPWESPYCPNCGARMEVEHDNA